MLLRYVHVHGVRADAADMHVHVHVRSVRTRASADAACCRKSLF